LAFFVPLDLLVFYLFFEASLVPMFFLWHLGRRTPALSAVKFFITRPWLVVDVVGIIALYFIQQRATGIGTFDYVVLSANAENRRDDDFAAH